MLWLRGVSVLLMVAEEVYFGKAKDVVGELRSLAPLSETNRDRATQMEMIKSMQR